MVANNGDGRVAFLEGGPDGLTLLGVDKDLAIPNPTSLALASIDGNMLSVYAATEGLEAAVLLTFLAIPSASGLTLLPSEDVSLPLIATLLTVENAEPETTELPGVRLTENALGFGQGLTSEASDLGGDRGEEEGEVEVEGGLPPVAQADDHWTRSVLGLQEAFDQLLREAQGRSPVDRVGDSSDQLFREDQGRPSLDDGSGPGAVEASPILGEPGLAQQRAGSRSGRVDVLEESDGSTGWELRQPSWATRPPIAHAPPETPADPASVRAPRSPVRSSKDDGPEKSTRSPMYLAAMAALMGGHLVALRRPRQIDLPVDQGRAGCGDTERPRGARSH